MGYNANVRSTFDARRFGKQASTVAIGFTFYTSLALSHESDPFIAYILLFSSALIVAVVHYIFTLGPNRVGVNVLRPNDSLQIRRMFLPILFGLATIAAVAFTLVAFTNAPLSANSFPQNFELIIFLTLAAFAEEFRFRFVDMQIFPYSPLTANAFFVLLHPQVARIFAARPPDLLFALFAFVFGLAMLGVVWLYEIPMPRFMNRGFGIVYAVVVHAGYNAIVTIWNVKVVGFEFRPF